jgi:predicted O-linked N-acetylglucosamine transferase (SPINDLY family)
MTNPTFDSPTQEIDHRRRAVRASPRNAQAHALLGLALQKHGYYEEAITSQRRALELDHKLYELHGILAAALYAVGDYRGAAYSYRQALRSQPHDAELQNGLDQAQRMADQAVSLDEARRAVAAAPDDISVLLTLAAAQHAASDLEGSAASFRQVTELEPGHATAWIERAKLEQQLHRYEDALCSYGRALELCPDNARLLGNQGSCLREAKRLEEAETCLRRAIALDAENPLHWTELGIILQMQSRTDESMIALKRSQQLDPDGRLMLQALTHSCFELGKWDEALRTARHAMELHPTPSTHSALLFILSHFTHDPQELTREHFSYGERWEAPLRKTWSPHPNGRDPLRKVRVGFVSPDLIHHAVSRFVEPIFGMLRHSTQVEWFVYFSHVEEDEITARMRGYMPNWRNIAHASDEQAERMIRADAIDILIDLSGHSGRNRLPLFARKPAPIQASWIGYAGTTGLTAMDYFISDQFHLPEGRYDDQFSEKIVRIPLIAPFLPPAASPDVNPLPALKNGYITFGSFHRASKISRETIALWSQLLRALPTSKLLLGGQGSGTEESVLAWLAEEGVERDRILLRPRAPIYQYLAQHHEVDVCLSPIPYSGSTTICYALWMGVPTLFTIGATNPSHSAVCYLAHLGLSSFLADDEPTFVALGRFLEQNPAALATLRASMRDRFNNSVVGYPGVAAAGLEHALRLMWQRWCAGQPAESLRVRLSDIAGGEERQPNGVAA